MSKFDLYMTEADVTLTIGSESVKLELHDVQILAAHLTKAAERIDRASRLSESYRRASGLEAADDD